MSDSKTEAGGRDRLRINPGEDREVRDWAAKYGVTPERLREAVEAVGDRPDAVAKYFSEAGGPA